MRIQRQRNEMTRGGRREGIHGKGETDELGEGGGRHQKLTLWMQIPHLVVSNKQL